MEGEQERKQGTSEQTTAPVPAREDSALCQGGGEGDGEKRSDLGYTFKEEPRGFVCRLDGMRGEKER